MPTHLAQGSVWLVHEVSLVLEVSADDLNERRECVSCGFKREWRGVKWRRMSVRVRSVVNCGFAFGIVARERERV